jgi:hypothetical protein
VACRQECLAAYPASVTIEFPGLIPERGTLCAIVWTGKFRPGAEGFDKHMVHFEPSALCTKVN